MKPYEPKVSVIICSRNRALQLKRCLKSINADEMTAVGAELILVNNNSTDSTLEVMESFKRETPFSVQIVNEPNTGLSRARNAGLFKAKGEIIVFTDDDCYLSKGYLTKANTIFDSEEFDYCGGQVWSYNETDSTICASYFDIKHIIEPFSFIEPGFIHGANMVFRRRVINKIGMFDIMLGKGALFQAADDTDYVARASWNGFRGARIPELIVYHDHGIKRGKEEDNVRMVYAAGRGAYYAKCILQGRFIYLVNWFRSTQLARPSRRSLLCFLREVKYGVIYLFFKAKNTIKGHK